MTDSRDKFHPIFARCKFCGEKLSARHYRLARNFETAPPYPLEFRHLNTGKKDCASIQQAAPNDTDVEFIHTELDNLHRLQNNGTGAKDGK